MNYLFEPMDEIERVYNEVLDLRRRKSADYQNPSSTVRQADYYDQGILTINSIIRAKMLRVQSLLEAKTKPKNESLEDSYKDIMNYASFAVAWLRGGIDGQLIDRDMFNRPIKKEGSNDLPQTVRL